MNGLKEKLINIKFYAKQNVPLLQNILFCGLYNWVRL
nr:MAG TPA: hypothetical protein [Caudoviricetes sp.]